MVGTSLVLLTIAILFLRNQIRPILPLAEAAESFGKGRPMPRDFSPRGAEEVRRAGLAFIQMRERIERQIEQRTAMLTGVSHDLRTILTRFRLQLALAGDNADVESLEPGRRRHAAACSKDISPSRAARRRKMPADSSCTTYDPKLDEEAELRKRKTVDHASTATRRCRVRPNGFTRLLANLVATPIRYANTVHIDARHSTASLTVTVDDDGPGIPPTSARTCSSRSSGSTKRATSTASGTGLGLAIARDIARSHGGDITLADSPLGGLRAIITVPA